MTSHTEPIIGFKKLDSHCIAKLEILGKNNQHRSNISNLATAKHRCQMAKVLDIYTFNDKNSKVTCKVSCHDKNFTYTVGKIVQANFYDDNIENICSNGIHYFLTEECARFYVLYGTFDDTAELFAYTGIYKTWYENGMLAVIGSFNCGKKEGEWISYSEDEKIASISHYKDNFLHGKVEQFNSQFTTIIIYKNGKFDGPAQHFDIDGKMISSRNYKDGKLDGEWIEYYKNGNVKNSTMYERDMRHGLHIEYYENGALKLERSFRYGNPIGECRSYYENGIVMNSCFFDENGDLDGEEIEYYETGAVKSNCTYKSNKRDGEYIGYYENGNVKIQYMSEDGIANGPYVEYYENGRVRIKANYKNNQYDGTYTAFNEDGSVILSTTKDLGLFTNRVKAYWPILGRWRQAAVR